MRIRNRISQDAELSPAYPPGYSEAWYSYEPNGSTVTTSWSYAGSGPKHLSGEFSSLSDEIGPGKRPKGCRHVVSRYNINYSMQDFMGGWTQYWGEQTSWYWTQTHPYPRTMFVADIQRFSWYFDDVASYANKWRVVFSLPHDAIIVNKLFQRARGQIADVMLNAWEAPQLASISSFASNLTGWGARWITLGRNLARGVSYLGSRVQTKARQRPMSRRALEKYLTSTAQFLALPHVSRKTMRQAVLMATRSAISGAKLSSDAYLTFMFGIAPLVSDICALHSSLGRLQKDWEHFRENRISRVSSTFVGKLEQGEIVSPSYVTFQVRTTTVPTKRYVLTYRPNPKRIETEFLARLDNLLTRFGPSGPASFAWELISFSFVCDWFIDLTGFLYDLDTFLGVEPVDVVSLTSSVTVANEVDLFYTVLDGHNPPRTIRDTSIGTVSNRLYERTVLTRSGIPVIRSRFGKSQFSVSIALAIQRLVKQRARFN